MEETEEVEEKCEARKEAENNRIAQENQIFTLVATCHAGNGRKTPSLRSKLNAYLARWMKDVLTHPDYTSDRRACKTAGVDLLYLMKQQKQALEHFTVHSTWGYTALKLSDRVQFYFLQFVRGAERLPGGVAMAMATVQTVLAFGGGPGPEIVAMALYRRWADTLSLDSHRQEEGEAADEIDYLVVDYCPMWEPIATHATTSAGISAEFLYGDVCCSLNSEQNARWASRISWGKPFYALFSFVLWESKHGQDLVAEVWEAACPGTLLFFSDPSCTLTELTTLFHFLIDGENCWWLDQNTLFALK